MTFLRRLVPYSLLPLTLIACFLAGAPWLRAFPADVMLVPLVGAALLSVLLPVVVVAIGVRRLWLTAIIDLVGFVFFTTLVTLREPAGFGDLWTGLVHGPAQILTFALPLVSPRTLLVAPIALCWIGGAVVGECLGRGWQSVLPYATLLVTFGLAYAATTRGITSTSDGRRYDTLLAGALLLTLLLIRAAQAWVEQDTGAETSQPDGVLPLRGLVVGVAVSVVVALAAALAVQTSAFSGHPRAPERQPPLDRAEPLTPLSFVAGLRPTDPGAAGTELFRVTLDGAASPYVAIADVDTYDGDGWSFSREFRPSGGAVPADQDPSARAPGQPVTQQYQIDRGPLTGTPWMPFLYRPQNVSGTSVNVDATSGMIVPSQRLRAGESYTVRSTASHAAFGTLPATTLTGTSPPPADTYVTPEVKKSLDDVVQSLRNETGTPSTASPIVFLQAVSKDFRANYALAGGPVLPGTTTPGTTTPGTTTPGSTTAAPPPVRTPTKPRSRPTPTRKATTRPNRFVQLAPARTPPAPRPSAPRPSVVRPSVVRPSAVHPSAVRTPAPTPTPSAVPTPTGSTGPAASGTSFANVLASILGPTRSATPEQYATLVALVARQLGVPARVVTGFRVGPADRTTVPGRTYRVTTREAWTWVEVPVVGRGWVVLDAAPGTYSTNTPKPSASVRPQPSAAPSSTPNAQLSASPSNAGNPPAPKSRVPASRGHSTVSVVLLVLGVVLALLVLVVLVFVLRKRLRVRRRRRTGDPRRRLIGAWQESLDVLVEAGLPDLTALTSAEVAAVTAEHFGNESAVQARYLGDSANAAIFSPTSWIDQQEADAAWRAQVVLRRSVLRRLSFRERLGAGVRYHRTRRPSPLVGPSSWASAAKQRASRTSGRGRRGGKHTSGRRRVH